jgi:uroporphyrinogen decarboxylase
MPGPALEPQSRPTASDKPLLRALRREPCAQPPIWLMRQAGRYLPEYRALRGRAGGFLEFCYTPELAVEATLQPIRRFGFDAAILFSDILVLPDALGQRVWFEEGSGPCLEPVGGACDLDRLSADAVEDHLAPVLETLSRLREALPEETALIGFAGAPWTVASYMVEGGSSRDFSRAKAWAYGDPDGFQRLIDLVTEATSRYLLAQVAAGAEVLQLFDSWAGVLPDDQLRRWCLEPAKTIVRRLKMRHPEVPIILFPRGAGVLYQDFAEQSGADGLSLDTALPVTWAREVLQDKAVLQGNLDPLLLVTGGSAMRDAVARIVETLGDGPFVFNLGHGIVPDTPPEHVAELVALVRGG